MTHTALIQELRDFATSYFPDKYGNPQVLLRAAALAIEELEGVVRECVKQMRGALNADDTGYPYDELALLERALLASPDTTCSDCSHPDEDTTMFCTFHQTHNANGAPIPYRLATASPDTTTIIEDLPVCLRCGKPESVGFQDHPFVAHPPDTT